MLNRLYSITKTISTVFLVGCLLLFIVKTWHWPLMGDAALMHYLVFLKDHGMAPYRDIIDANMPTTLILEGAVMHLFGGNSITWRLFDFFLLALAGVSFFVICRPYSRFAALFAASLFALIHGRDGLIDLGQRDLTMAVCLLIAYAFLFSGLRVAPGQNSKPWMTAFFGLFCGIAATVKPSIIFLAPCVLCLQVVMLHRRRRPFLAHAISGLIGLFTPILLVFAWLYRQHIVPDFLHTVSHLVPYLLLLGTRSYPHLIAHTFSSVMLPLVLLWLPIVILKKNWITWERAAMMIAVLFGLISFYMQKRGFAYHRYPSEAFLLILIAIDFTKTLQEGTPRLRLRFSASENLLPRLAFIGILAGVFWVAGGSTAHALWQDWRNQEFDTMLRQDLTRFGGQKLTGRVQCLDVSDGCPTALYNMNLTQSTGHLYDCYLFYDQPNAERDRIREQFWREITKNPPALFVVSSNDCESWPQRPGYNYQKMSRWPQFNDYLNANYHIYVERIPPHMVNSGSSPSKPVGYRIYVQNSIR
jgi:hypothetical protein